MADQNLLTVNRKRMDGAPITSSTHEEERKKLELRARGAYSCLHLHPFAIIIST